MAFIEILTADGLTVEQWDASLFVEYIEQLWWKNLMGTSSNAIIQVKDDLMKKAGDAITLGLRGRMQGGKVTGNATGLGNEGSVSFFNERITIDNVRHLIKIVDVPMSQKRTSFDVIQHAKEALVQKSQVDLDEEITRQLSDTTQGRVQGRYLYGALDTNFNATHTVALANVDATDDMLTTQMIDIAKRKALRPLNATAKIRPMRVKLGKAFEEWYVFVAHPLAIRDMVENDAAWRNAQLNIPPMANSMSVLYTGSSFKGSWNGTLIYEYEDIELETNTNSIQAAHNLFLGAQAAAVVWGQRSKFGEEEVDLGHTLVFETHEIRGVQKLVFSRATEEDQGIVHVFSAAVND